MINGEAVRSPIRRLSSSGCYQRRENSAVSSPSLPPSLPLGGKSRGIVVAGRDIFMTRAPPPPEASPSPPSMIRGVGGILSGISRIETKKERGRSARFFREAENIAVRLD